MTRRRDVYQSSYASTLVQCCREAWQARFSFFAHGGQAHVVLGIDEYVATGVEVKELAG